MRSLTKVLPRGFAAATAALCMAAAAHAADPLPSWNDGASKKSIVEFVAKVTNEKTPDFVPVAERIAVFDNDGTLWAEQPMYFQLFFALDRVKTLAPDHPEWASKEPFASLLKGDVKSALAGGEKAILEIVVATHAGMTTAQFETIVKEWLETAKHPTTERPFTEMVYQPMLELLAYLRANGFKTFIVSGGGIEFMRPWTERVYGIPPEQVVGSSIKTKLDIQDGKPVLVRLPELDFIDDKEGKPVGINSHIGRRPIAAFGNSDGDLQMLQWTTAGEGARFALFVHHTDAEREWAYDRKSHIGKLDKGLDAAKASGWTVVDMKKDWKVIYPAAAKYGFAASARLARILALPFVLMAAAGCAKERWSVSHSARAADVDVAAVLASGGFPFPRAESRAITEADFPFVIEAARRANEEHFGPGADRP